MQVPAPPELLVLPELLPLAPLLPELPLDDVLPVPFPVAGSGAATAGTVPSVVPLDDVLPVPLLPLLAVLSLSSGGTVLPQATR